MSWFRSDAALVADELQQVYQEYLRLGRQLEAQAEAAPYPQVAERLREIVATQEKSALVIAERLAVIGRHAATNGEGPIRTGRNSWERLVGTLEDYRELLRKLSQLHARWDDEHPEDAALIRRLRESASAHREVIVDLVARSDPHALD